jgi:hypothetical protein
LRGQNGDVDITLGHYGWSDIIKCEAAYTGEWKLSFDNTHAMTVKVKISSTSSASTETITVYFSIYAPDLKQYADYSEDVDYKGGTVYEGTPISMQVGSLPANALIGISFESQAEARARASSNSYGIGYNSNGNYISVFSNEKHRGESTVPAIMCKGRLLPADNNTLLGDGNKKWKEIWY